MSFEDRLQAALDRQEIAEFIVTNAMLGDSRMPEGWERYQSAALAAQVRHLS